MYKICDLPPLGFNNQNNICYLNSFLQLLFSCDIFDDIEISFEINECHRINKLNGTLLEIEDESLMGEKYINQKISYDYRYIIKKILFEKLLDYCVEIYLFYKNREIEPDKNLSIVLSKILNILSTSIVHGQQQDVTEAFFVLINSLDIEHKIFFRYYEILSCGINDKETYRFKQENKTSYIEFLVNEYYGDDRISESYLADFILDTYTYIPDYICEICETRCNVKKQRIISFIPDNIFIYVVRSSVDDLDMNLIFPPTFNINSSYGYISKYELTGVVNYSANVSSSSYGISQSSGHYQCTVIRNGIVFNCNDNVVKIDQSKSYIITDNHCIFLYYKKIKECYNDDYKFEVSKELYGFEYEYRHTYTEP